MKKIWNQLGHSLFAEDESSRKTKHILKTVFFFYILVLLKVIVFKYPLARLEAIAASWTKEVVWEGLGTANFTLFKTIRMYIRYWGKLNSFENLFGNVLAFVPLGFLLPFLQKESRRFWILFLDAFVLVCCIELQLLKPTDCRFIRMRQAADSTVVSQEKREGQAYEQKDYFNGGSPHRTSSCGPLCRLFEGACKTAEFRSV